MFDEIRNAVNKILSLVGTSTGTSVVDDDTGAVKTNLATGLSKTVDSVTSRPEGRTYSATKTASANAIYTGSLILCGMYVNSTSSGTVQIFDSLTQTGTNPFGTITPAVGWHYLGDVTFATGLSLTVGSTISVTFVYIPVTL